MPWERQHQGMFIINKSISDNSVIHWGSFGKWLVNKYSITTRAPIQCHKWRAIKVYSRNLMQWTQHSPLLYFGSQILVYVIWKSPGWIMVISGFITQAFFTCNWQQEISKNSLISPCNDSPPTTNVQTMTLFIFTYTCNYIWYPNQLINTNKLDWSYAWVPEAWVGRVKPKNWQLRAF